MKLLNKTKALSATLSQLLDAQDFIEQLVRLKEKAQDWDEHKHIVSKHFEDQYNKDLAEQLKRQVDMAHSGQVEPTIQYFKKIDTEDASARGFITPPNDDHLTDNGRIIPDITQEQGENVEKIIEKGELLTDTKQDYFILEYKYNPLRTSIGSCPYALLLGNTDNSKLVEPTTHYCTYDKNHKGQHRTSRNNIAIFWDNPKKEIEEIISPNSEKESSFSRPSEQTGSLSNDKTINRCTSSKEYPNLHNSDTFTVYCELPDKHQGEHIADIGIGYRWDNKG